THIADDVPQGVAAHLPALLEAGGHAEVDRVELLLADRLNSLAVEDVLALLQHRGDGVAGGFAEVDGAAALAELRVVFRPAGAACAAALAAASPAPDVVDQVDVRDAGDDVDRLDDRVDHV